MEALDVARAMRLVFCCPVLDFSLSGQENNVTIKVNTRTKKLIRNVMNTWYKTIAYACLYKVQENVSEKEITISIVRDRKPSKLMSFFENEGFKITEYEKGIYHISTPLFPTQVVVGDELDEKEHIWIASLTDRLSAEEARILMANSSKFTDFFNRDLAESVMDPVIEANRALFEELIKEDQDMSEALAELMAPEFRKQREEGREEGEERLGRLYAALLKEGKVEEAKKASTDKNYRTSLFALYKI